MNMGVKFGAEVLKDLRSKLEDYFPIDKYCNTSELSIKLEKLCSLLEERQDSDPRILVFVQTRQSASR